MNDRHDSIPTQLAELIGLRCVDINIGDYNSIRITLSATSTDAASSWEIGTFFSGWRIVRGSVVVVGRSDEADLLREKLPTAGEFGTLAAIEHPNPFDVSFRFSSGLVVDFATISSDDEEVVFIYCPDNKFIQFDVAGGWRVGPSDRPWL